MSEFKTLKMKKLILIIFTFYVATSFTTINSSLPSEKGTLSGMVTYKTSCTSADKADAGSEIYIINESEVSSSTYRDLPMVVENFQNNKSDFAWLQYNVVDPVKVKKIQDNFDTLSGFAYRFIRGFRTMPGVVRNSADGAGKFSLTLQPGRYYILAISGNLKSDNIVESTGKILYRMVEVKSADKPMVNITFEKQDRLMPILISRSLLKGC